jgi:RimJ/RimL family protein N-acetyltransferase
MTQDKISLKSVNKTDHEFLFDLLKNRDPRANISHKKMPSFKEHVKFINSKPYQKWYVIKLNHEKVGSIYLSKQNEIGLFLKKNTQGQNIGTKALKLLITKNPEKRILANINPKNKKSIKFFKKHGFKLIQYTFELET